MKKKILWLMIITLLITSALSACSNNIASNSNVDKEESFNKKKEIVYFISGKLQADESAVVTSKINGRVSEINVDVGSTVNKGDYIIKLDSKDLQALVAQQQAAVNVAAANLNKIKSGSRPEQIAQAQAALESAKINFENTNSNNKRNKDLFDVGAISKSQLDQSETGLAAAEASYKSAQAALDMLNKGETAESIAISEAQLKNAEAALNTAQIQLQNGAIEAPIAGVVSSRNINNGELATVGAPLVSIVNLDTVMINAYMPSTLINKIAVNQEVSIKISEIPDKKFKGEVLVVDPAIDPKNKNILVKVKFKDKDPLLKPGMFAEIGIEEQEE